jgi:hypothetical protein
VPIACFAAAHTSSSHLLAAMVVEKGEQQVERRQGLW